MAPFTNKAIDIVKAAKVQKNNMNGPHPPHPNDRHQGARPPHMNHPGDLEQFPMVS